MDKYEDIIEVAKNYLLQISDDCEHNIHHTEDVVEFCELICRALPNEIEYDKECVMVSAWWHDVGRLTMDDGHERLSASMLKNALIEGGHSPQFAEKCYKAVESHKWNMTPTTTEGLILKDADKLGWIGLGRWSECIDGKQKLTQIIKLLPKLRNEILHFEQSKNIYDQQVLNLINFLHNKIL